MPRERVSATTVQIGNASTCEARPIACDRMSSHAEIAKIEGVVVDVAAVESNIVILRLAPAARSRAEVVQRLQDHGVLVCECPSILRMIYRGCVMKGMHHADCS